MTVDPAVMTVEATAAIIISGLAATTTKKKNTGRTICVLYTGNKVEKNRSKPERFFYSFPSLFLLLKKMAENGKLVRGNQFKNRCRS
jgi:hypothetical protein